MVRKLILTKDGSHTIQMGTSHVTYHSMHGAVQESNHVFIQSGLHFFHQEKKKESIRIAEVGFGTGLNALLSLDYALRHSIHIYYAGIEAFPLESELFSLLNYHKESSIHPQATSYFQQIHTSEWNQIIELCKEFSLYKTASRIQDFNTNELYDVIYFDAFAPNHQAEMWTEEIFRKLYSFMENEGILVTYCSKGVIRRRLEQIGFTIEKIPGPPGKREMLRGRKMM